MNKTEVARRIIASHKGEGISVIWPLIVAECGGTENQARAAAHRALANPEPRGHKEKRASSKIIWGVKEEKGE